MGVGMFREDRLQPTFKRIRRTVTLGPCSHMSRRAALAALQPYLDAVNVAPPPTPRKVGKTFSDAAQSRREQIAGSLNPSTVRAPESHQAADTAKQPRDITPPDLKPHEPDGCSTHT